MNGDIEVTLTLEIAQSCSMTSVSSMLEGNHYSFSATAKKVSYDGSAERVTPNNVVQCKKNIAEGDIGHIHAIGDELVNMEIGITRVISRVYRFLPRPEEQPEKWWKQVILLAAHAVLIFFITFGTIHLLEPTFNLERSASIAGIPAVIDFGYYMYMTFKQRVKGIP